VAAPLDGGKLPAGYRRGARMWRESAQKVEDMRHGCFLTPEEGRWDTCRSSQHPNQPAGGPLPVYWTSHPTATHHIPTTGYVYTGGMQQRAHWPHQQHQGRSQASLPWRMLHCNNQAVAGASAQSGRATIQARSGIRWKGQRRGFSRPWGMHQRFVSAQCVSSSPPTRQHRSCCRCCCYRRVQPASLALLPVSSKATPAEQ
jgi:hypothetical protein